MKKPVRDHELRRDSTTPDRAPTTERPPAAETDGETPLVLNLGIIDEGPVGSLPEPLDAVPAPAQLDGTATDSEPQACPDGDGTAPPAPPREFDLTPMWQNSRWAVTAVGLESRTRAGPHQVLVEYVIERERLLRGEPGTEGVSSWAIQLAAKTWVDDVDAMIEAIESALRIHHPGQAVVDMGTTAAEARRVWERSRLSARASDELGHDHLEDAEARFAAYRRRS